jgi:predicted negative regulator of RcsB-dependent stress response
LARLHLARLLTARGLARDAVAVLEPALQPEDADTPGYAIAMGTVYAAAGRPGEAKAAWQNAMTLARQFNQPQVAGEAARLLSQTR